MLKDQEKTIELYVMCRKTIEPETLSNPEIAQILENAGDTEIWIKRMFTAGATIWCSFLTEIAQRLRVLESLRNKKC